MYPYRWTERHRQQVSKQIPHKRLTQNENRTDNVARRKRRPLSKIIKEEEKQAKYLSWPKNAFSFLFPYVPFRARLSVLPKRFLRHLHWVDLSRVRAQWNIMMPTFVLGFCRSSGRTSVLILCVGKRQRIIKYGIILWRALPIWLFVDYITK